MRRKTAVILTVLLLAFSFGIPAKAEESGSWAPEQETEGSDSWAPEQEAGSGVLVTEFQMDRNVVYSEEEQVLFEAEGCKMTATGYDPFSIPGFVVNVTCENTSHKKLLFSVSGAAVNGYMLDSDWSLEVAPGKTEESQIIFGQPLLTRHGFSVIDDIQLDLYVVNANNWMDDPVFEGKAELYPSGKAPEEVWPPERMYLPGEQIIEDNGTFAFVLLEEEPDGPGGYTLRTYIENRTDRNLMMSWENVSVNDSLIDPYWAVGIMAGKRCYADIVFPKAEFEKNGIIDVGEIGLTMTVYDSDDWMAPALYNSTFTIYP